ncbi:MAG: family 16 glycosylhydrolase [Pseudomonadota bacterium]
MPSIRVLMQNRNRSVVNPQSYRIAEAKYERFVPDTRLPALLFVFVLALTSPVTTTPSVADENVVTGASFFDGFERLGRHRWNISDGWSNGDHQSCRWRKRNIAIKDGILIFTLGLEPDVVSLTKRPEGEADTVEKTQHDRDYSCAEIQTKQEFGYGTYETRMTSAPVPGTVSAMFTYIGPGLNPDKPHDEIDFEVLGKDTTKVQLNFFRHGKAENDKLVPFGYDNATTMSRMAFEWFPNALRWYLDGKLVHEVKPTAEKPIPSEPSRIMLSLWSGQGRNMEDWLSRFDPSTLPQQATYDYVAFTKMGEPCQFPESVVCRTNPAPKKPDTDKK